MQDKITIADAPECLNTNDKAMWVLGYQAALAARSTCLHQIQVPSAAEQAAWHARLDEGRAQAALPVDDRDWREPTTNLQRLRESMTLLCRGNQPTDEMLTGWIDGTSDALQDFAATHGPSWAQGIGIIDAATLMADQPTEGPDHEMLEPQAAPAAVAVADELAALEDATWYWVEKEGWIGDPPTIAPALYKAEIDAWYSFAFSGIPTRQLKVLAPCLMKARAAFAATPAADAKQAEFEAIRMFWAQHGSQKVLGMSTLADLHADVERTIRQHATAAAPVVLPEPDFWVRPGATIHPDRGWQCWSNDGTATGAFHADTVRALLAGVSAPAAVEVDIADLVTGMSVSVDVSTGDDDAGNRYFGTVTVAQEDAHEKHGLTLLVQDAKPNFAPQAQADARDAGDTCAACFFEGSCEHQAIQQKADRYDFIVKQKLILSGGSEKFGWPIAPFGSECDRYIDAAIAAAKGE